MKITENMLAYHMKWSRKTGKVVLTLVKLVPINECMLKMISTVPLLLCNCSFRKLIQLQLLFSITVVKILCRPKHRIMNIFGAQINPSKLTNSLDLLHISPRMPHAVWCIQLTVSEHHHSRDDMSVHRNESSVRSYNRSCSTMQNNRWVIHFPQYPLDALQLLTIVTLWHCVKLPMQGL